MSAPVVTNWRCELCGFAHNIVLSLASASCSDSSHARDAVSTMGLAPQCAVCAEPRHRAAEKPMGEMTDVQLKEERAMWHCRFCAVLNGACHSRVACACAYETLAHFTVTAESGDTDPNTVFSTEVTETSSGDRLRLRITAPGLVHIKA